MSYSKLYKVVQDHGLGFQTINKAIANTDATRSAYAVEHGVPDENLFTLPNDVAQLDGYGQHSSPLIPRDVCRIGVGGYGTLGTADLRFAFIVTASPYGIFTGVTRFEEGVYFVATAGLQDDCWCEVMCDDDGGAMLRGVTRYVLGGTSGWGPDSGVVVQTFRLDPLSPPAVLADADFHLALFSNQ